MSETTYLYQDTQLDKTSVTDLIRSTYGGSGRVLKRSSIMAEITELHLKLGGQHDCESPGREWIKTSIEEVCEILRSIDPGLTLSTLPQIMHNAATSAQCCE